MYKLYSFDVFDTLLLRNEKSEPFRFYEIAGAVAEFFNQNGYKLTQNDVLLARYLATESTYRLSDKVKGCREGSIEDIYKSICSMLNVDSSLWEEALKEEVEYEKKNVSFNYTLWDEIKEKARSNDAKMILISDIYLQSKYIQELLVDHKPNFFDECDRLYSSADYIVSKASGHLFDIAKDDFKLDESECLHMGDNIVTDFKNPKKRGWNADFIPIVKERKEKIDQNFIEIREKLKSENIIIPQIEREAKRMING